MDSKEVRDKLIDALKLDLVGPFNEKFKEEVLQQSPSRWYLTGFLVPTEADDEQKMDEDCNEEIDESPQVASVDEGTSPESTAHKKSFFPSSIGLSLLVSKNTKSLNITANWGDYHTISPDSLKEDPAKLPVEVDENSEEERNQFRFWKRSQFSKTLSVNIPDGEIPVEYDIPDSGNVKLVLSARPLNLPESLKEIVPAGSKSISVFLVNKRKPAEKGERDKSFIFQADISVQSEESFIPRPNFRGLDSKDWDERVADVQYRNNFEFAVGHGVATDAVVNDGQCTEVSTTWIPRQEVEKVDPASISGVEFSMEKLAAFGSSAKMIESLMPLCTQYVAWIGKQEVPSSPANRKDTGDQLLANAKEAARRIKEGIELLGDEKVFKSFQLANKVMAKAARQRFSVIDGVSTEEVREPSWRPFQLAFVLMNLKGIVKPHDSERAIVDLLFFPTGGGKTEAYLGLAAFTLIFRRLANNGVDGCGVSVLMRYTLRLLTLDQLGRASTLICALELEREQNNELGDWPFEIGLWVGKAATPNQMGYKGHKRNAETARGKVHAFKDDDRKPSPLPLEDCPWCGKKFDADSFRLVPDDDKPNELHLRCSNSRRCDFAGNRRLPVVGVDEQIYSRLPCFLIATVDKFAAMPWTGQVGSLFGKVTSYDKGGFYGPSDGKGGTALPNGLPPPDLIIQDELHLISGPMGTMVGLYETALDELSARQSGDEKIYPKIIASTATVRRADKPVRALFGRDRVDIFPAPGPNLRDSFFAVTKSPDEVNARSYIGIAAQGRSTKMLLLKSTVTLMSAAQKLYKENGGKIPENPVDPYMTALGYFNSLRELGGSRRIIEDEVKTRLSGYWNRKRIGELQDIFANRYLKLADHMELTSRVDTGKVAATKRKLNQLYSSDEASDVVLATNMISVGLDIPRLGLMLVMGQPKTTAEYIQSSSRVGRDKDKPGLVVALYNIHRHRDRSIYERFGSYHQSFYREVEATSVTPFSPRALDRGLAGAVVSLARHIAPAFNPPDGASKILDLRPQIDQVVDMLADRAKRHDKEMTEVEANRLRQDVRDRVIDLLDEWSHIAQDCRETNTTLQYQTETKGAKKRLLFDFLDPEMEKDPEYKFKANRSMRDVEPSVNLFMRELKRKSKDENAESDS